MKFFHKKFRENQFNLYCIGDWHLGSQQCRVDFIKKVINQISNDPNGYWVGMGDWMENAIIGSKSDVYTQNLPPKEQMEYAVELLKPIKDKGLFMIAGNHESRTHRLVGLTPEEYIGYQLDVPFKAFLAMLFFNYKVKTPIRLSVTFITM